MANVPLFYRRLATEGPGNLQERLVLFALTPLGWLYGMAMRLRAFCYRYRLLPRCRAAVPVVSVGNLAVGGTGKTPLVDHLVKFFLARGIRVAVVSRGYGGVKRKAVRTVCAGRGPLLGPEECGDEPFLLARRNPGALVLVSPHRVAAVRAAVTDLHAQVVLLDDGFQHLKLQRDLDIVLLDARHPFGNGRVLPAGLLREPRTALKRGDLFLLTRCDKDLPSPPAVAGPVLCSRHVLADQASDLAGRQIALTDLRGRRGLAFAGIADPGSFFRALEEKNLTLQATLSLNDHCVYDAAVIRRLTAMCGNADYLVTTEKDAVKLTGRELPLPCYQVPMALEFLQPGRLESYLEAVISSKDRLS